MFYLFPLIFFLFLNWYFIFFILGNSIDEEVTLEQQPFSSSGLDKKDNDASSSLIVGEPSAAESLNSGTDEKRRGFNILLMRDNAGKLLKIEKLHYREVVDESRSR